NADPRHGALPVAAGNFRQRGRRRRARHRHHPCAFPLLAALRSRVFACGGGAMIGKLTGRLDFVSANAVIVDAGGVGYEVTIGARTFTALPPPGEIVTLAIDTHVRG